MAESTGEEQNAIILLATLRAEVCPGLSSPLLTTVPAPPFESFPSIPGYYFLSGSLAPRPGPSN